MLVLGITDGHDAGACLVDASGIWAAVNEERLTRTKMQCGFPALSIKQCLEIANKKSSDITHVALAGRGAVNEREDRDFRFAFLHIPQKIIFCLSRLGLLKFFFLKLPLKMTSKFMFFLQRGRFKEIKKKLVKIGIRTDNFSVIDHHFAHACSAYYTSGWDKALVLTLDASGDSSCSQAYWVEGNKFNKIRDIPWIHSPCYYYLAVTILLGFKMGREGKVTGLAAHGNPDKCVKELEKKIIYNSKLKRFHNRGGYIANEIDCLKNKFNCQNAINKDIAAGVQTHYENVVSEYLRDILKEINENKINLCLAGGGMANVKLNQRLSEFSEVEQIFVHPNMTDGGLALGSAFAVCKSVGIDLTNNRINDVYLGKQYSNQEIKRVLDKSNLVYKFYEDVEKKIGRFLFEGNLIARFNGRMEYGPRALGNRSILYQATDITVNEWLNKSLQRTEFMPFAPVVLEEYVNEYFTGNDKLQHAFRFMTTTCNVTNLCRIKAPAVVHVDGTARPQVVNLRSNQSFYKILKHYYELSKIPVLINTSFNMHEEPIVESPGSAIDAFLRMKTGLLAIGNYVVEGKGSVNF